MSYFGRYQAVRGIGPMGPTPPYILDRRRNRLFPRECDEWWKSPDGVWIPTMSGGVGWQGMQINNPSFYMGVGFRNAGLSQGTLALSNAYVGGTSGNACGVRWLCPDIGQTITDIYFYIASYTGTAANVTDIDWEIRYGATYNQPNFTAADALLASGTVNPASATGWIHAASGLSVTPSGIVPDQNNGNIGRSCVYIIVADKSGNATDFATIFYQSNGGATSQGWNLQGLAMSTTAGFSGGNISYPSSLWSHTVVIFANGGCLGSSSSSRTTTTSDTNRKGIVFDGLLVPMRVWAFVNDSQIGSALTGAEIYEGSPTPGASNAYATSSTLVTDGGTSCGVQFNTPIILRKNDFQRLVYTFSSGSGGEPRKYNIGTGADANLRTALPLGGGNWYWAGANGTIDWSNDDINAYPTVHIFVDEYLPNYPSRRPQSDVGARIGSRKVRPE